MGKEEILCTPIGEMMDMLSCLSGEMMDMLSCLSIYEGGAKEKAPKMSMEEFLKLN